MLKPTRCTLTDSNTLAIACLAQEVWDIHSVNDLEAWRSQWRGERFRVLGGGSNVILPNTLHAPLLRIRIAGVDISDAGDVWHVTAGAGEPWHDFVIKTLQHGAYGLENLALIPGTVGASPIQNIGAYGVEVGALIEGVTVWDAHTGTVTRLSREQCELSYRHSVFKTSRAEGWVIVSVTYALKKRPNVSTEYGELAGVLSAKGIRYPTPQQVCEAVIEIRRSKLPDPGLLPNAGSFFKNPIVDACDVERLTRQWSGLPVYPQADGRSKIAAGWLIDRMGWKGRKLGPVSVHEKQALVLVNHGGSADDVLTLARRLQADVQQTYGVSLELEPVVF